MGREATLLSAWNSYVSQPQTSPSGWWRRAERPQILSLLHSDSDLAMPQIQSSPQIQSLVLSLWYSLSLPILRYVTEIKIQTGVQQGVRWKGGDQTSTHHLLKTSGSHTGVSQQTPCNLLFSKCAAGTQSPALSPVPKSTWVQYLHKLYKCLPGFWTFNALIKNFKSTENTMITCSNSSVFFLKCDDHFK